MALWVILWLTYRRLYEEVSEMPHEKGQEAASSFDNILNHSWLGAVERATFMLKRVISQLRGLKGSELGTRNLQMPIALSVLVVLAGYYAGSIFGIQLGLRPSGIGATWPPTAILLAALLLAPPRYWWMYLLGVVPTHLHVVASFQVPEVPLVVMLCQVGSNILLAVLAAFAFRSLIGAPPQLGNRRNMGAFVLLAVLATAVASAVAAWLFLLTGWAADFWFVWRQRVLANVFTIVAIPPVIVQAFAGQLLGAHATWRSYLELASITVGVLVVGIPVFGLESPGASNLPALLLAPLPFLIWAAVRVGVGGTGLTLLIVAGIALANAYVGRGPFTNQAPGINVFSLQIFLTAISIPILMLAALVEERQRDAESLKQAREQAELALAERDALLALAGKTARVGSYVKDIETGKMQVSSGYAAIHGLPEGTSETTAEDWRARVHPDDLGRLDASRNGVVGERRPEHTAEYRIIGPDGSVRWIEARALISYGDDGRAQRAVGINIDVTRRKRAELSLADRNKQLELAGKAGLVGRFAIDVDVTREDFTSNRMQVSPGFSAIYGLPEETAEISVSDWRSQVHPDDLSQFLERRQQVFAQLLREHHAEFRIVRPCGTIRWIETRSYIDYDQAGRAKRMVGVNIDITERKRAEEARTILNAELDHRVKNALATVNAVVSHTREGSRSVGDFITVLEGRLRSMASAHELLSAHQWQGVSLTELVRRELAPYSTLNNTEINGPDILLKPETAQALAMVLHELATNAAKHGALSTKEGLVSIRWDRRLNGQPRSGLVLEWQEVGGPPIVAPGPSSYGMSTIRDLIPYELGGAVDLVLAPDGARCRLELPADYRQ
jgi:PAS domain S-box-containing protein